MLPQFLVVIIIIISLSPAARVLPPLPVVAAVAHSPRSRSHHSRRSLCRCCIPVPCVFCHIARFIFPVHTFTPAAVDLHPRVYLYRLPPVDIRLLVPCLAPHPRSTFGLIPPCYYARRTCHPHPHPLRATRLLATEPTESPCARGPVPPSSSPVRAAQRIAAVVGIHRCSRFLVLHGVVRPPAPPPSLWVSLVLAHVVCTLQSARSFSLPVRIALAPPCLLPPPCPCPFVDLGCHS